MVTVIVGGQFGSEGKGKIASYLALKENVDICVRTGGPNAGHTVDYNGFKHVSRQLPSGYINPETRLLIGAGGLIDLDLLKKETTILATRYPGIEKRVIVDGEAVVLNEHSASNERDLGMSDRLGSTQTGTGAAMIEKMWRDTRKCKLYRNEKTKYYASTCGSVYINNAINNRGSVILEGTQGFGLSIHHGGFWPYCTSRDTTAAAVCSEAGVSPMVVDRVIMVVRTHPIRVGGNSGPLRDEIDWKTVLGEAKWPDTSGLEITSVTKKVRRVGRFDWELFKKAVAANRPNSIAVHGADYLDYANQGAREWDQLTPEAQEFIVTLEMVAGCSVHYIFTGPKNEDIIDRTGSKLAESRVVVEDISAD
jgi:adenylosuccinate synthase